MVLRHAIPPARRAGCPRVGAYSAGVLSPTIGATIGAATLKYDRRQDFGRLGCSGGSATASACSS